MKSSPQEQRLNSFWSSLEQISSFDQTPTPRERGVSYHNSKSYWLDSDKKTLIDFTALGIGITALDDEDKKIMNDAIAGLPTYALKNQEAIAHLALNMDECKNRKPLSTFQRLAV